MPDPEDTKTQTATDPTQPAATGATGNTDPAPAADPKPGSDPAPAADPKDSTEEPKVTPKAPEKYDLKLPDGSPLENSRVEAIAAEARKHDLSNEQAQFVLERESDAVQSYQQSVEAEAAKWVDAAKKDPEIGGEKFAENVEFAKRAIDKFGSADLKKALDTTRLGDHPELIRFASKIGRAMADDTLVQADPGGPAKKEKTHAERIYGQAGVKQS
jgi:hypothetical protein